MAEVRVGENETFESALRRFNKKIQQSGILAEARRREHYEKPSVKRKRKEAKRKKATRQDDGGPAESTRGRAALSHRRTHDDPASPEEPCPVTLRERLQAEVRAAMRG